MAKKNRKKIKKPARRLRKKAQKRKVIKARRAKPLKRKPVKKRRKKIQARKKPVKRVKKRAARKKPAKITRKRAAPLLIAGPDAKAYEPEVAQPPMEKPGEKYAKKAAADSREKNKGFPVKTVLAVLAVIAAAVIAVLFFLKPSKCGETYAGLMPFVYSGEDARMAREGSKAGTADISKRHIEAVASISAETVMGKEQKEYFSRHFTALNGPDAGGWTKNNGVKIGLVLAEKTAKITWTREKACEGPKSRGWLYKAGTDDKKKIESFTVAAGALIKDENIRRQAIDYFAGPSVDVDAAGDAASYYLSYLAHAVIFESYKSAAGIAPPYPQVEEGGPAEFLAMEEMFRLFEKKAGMLAELVSAVEKGGGTAEKTTVELTAALNAVDNETRQKFITTALNASLAARQWAKMENSKPKSPWFETTYDADLNEKKVEKYLAGSAGLKNLTEAEKKLNAAASLMLYKTSRCMGTFTWNKKYMDYSENYRLAHSIIMHYIYGYDAAMCKKVADELDRYYAGRYYGTVVR